MANVMQTAERGTQAGGECLGHLGGECLAAWISPGSRFGCMAAARALPSEQAARAATSARILSKSSSSSVCGSIFELNSDRWQPWPRPSDPGTIQQVR